jgi:serine/threonine protein kinase
MQTRLAEFDHLLITLSDFELQEQLGRGSFGTVARALDKRTGWPVAVKELNPRALPRKELELFQREVEILIKCNDQFLLKLVGFAIEPQYLLVTEFMPRGSLWDFFRKNPGQLSPTQRTNIAIGIAHGMRYLHSRRIIHRDLKSANILLDDQLLPHIGDFGLGKFVGFGSEITQCTGTVQWMAPEQVFTQTYGPSVDVFAFGMVMYELLTENVPYAGLSQGQIYRLLETGNRPVLPPEIVGEPIAGLVYHCWAQMPEQRPTFAEIYGQFANGVVAFPGTDPGGVRKLLQMIERRERSRGLDIADIGVSASERGLFEAACDGDVSEFYQIVLRNVVDVNARNGDGLTPFHAAVIAGQAAMVEFMLLITEVDVNSVENRGATPLLTACAQSNVEMVRILLRSQLVNVNLRDRQGNAAIHIAIQVRSVEIVRLLLEREQLELGIAGPNGVTAFELAQQLQLEEIVGLIAGKL